MSHAACMPLTRLASLALALLLPVLVQAESRVALVIGNGAYANGPLINPASDARLVDETLKELGFHVILRVDADQKEMKRAIKDFGAALGDGGKGAVGLFYYAGHGVQVNGRNYLIPTRASIEREADVDIEAVSADWVISEMRAAGNALNIIVLDACRNNPFTRSLRGADRGLATMDAPAGILIAYSTAPGSVAEDGGGRNSPYTTQLTRAMHEHLPVEQVFKHVRVGVMGATSARQVPWEASSLVGEDFCFVSCKAPGPAAALVNVRPESNLEPAAKTPGMWDTISRWFGGTETDNHAAQVPPAPPPARSEPPPGATIAGSAAVGLLGSLGIEPNGIDAQHSYPPETLRALVENAPRRVTLGSTQQQIQAALTLCRKYASDCEPSWYGDEVLRSAVLKPYQLDATPVSVRAFRQFADASHYRTTAEKLGYAWALTDGGHMSKVSGGSWRNAIKRRPLEDNAPVVGVSFQDALAYCHANDARLPTEDEWEYVARGPQRHVFPWGSDDASPVSRALSVPPAAGEGLPEGIGGRYKGLSGNVWQWVDGRAKNLRVLKGGSWLETNAANKRAAARRLEQPDLAGEDSGFRCARSVAAWPDTDFWLAGLLKSPGR
jgi:formylglycine-generating enzyme required for sulfatase activity